MIVGVRGASPARHLPCNFAVTSRFDVVFMKADIHPQYGEVSVTCSCGNQFKTRSTLCKDLRVEVCSNCHPFFTGQQKIISTDRQVEKFNRRYGGGAGSA